MGKVRKQQEQMVAISRFEVKEGELEGRDDQHYIIIAGCVTLLAVLPDGMKRRSSSQGGEEGEEGQQQTSEAEEQASMDGEQPQGGWTCTEGFRVVAIDYLSVTHTSSTCTLTSHANQSSPRAARDSHPSLTSLDTHTFTHFRPPSPHFGHPQRGRRLLCQSEHGPPIQARASLTAIDRGGSCRCYCCCKCRCCCLRRDRCTFPLCSNLHVIHTNAHT